MFDHNSRFQIKRQLGAGGMGVVYEADDRLRNVPVALKTLRQTDVDLYRLKREFRGLRDVVHRNLVSLDELFEEDGQWFFTMELIDGEPLGTYLLRSRTTTQEPHQHLTPATQRDFELLRAVFAQFTQGLLAIHDAGKIHRDIKPSNVMVTESGRVVILDFGLVTDLRDDTERKREREIVGTLAYMAPEVGAGRQVGPEADWYSFGVMLYEAITGHWPFDGPMRVVLAAKQHSEIRSPQTLNPHCPDDLAQLCLRLLHSDPSQRPHGAEVLRELSGSKYERVAPQRREGPSSSRGIFVGREAELSELHRALDDVNAGAAVIIFIHGESGIGKSTLIDRFIATLGSVTQPVVLTGRCFEHESVPFKTIDGIIDGLSSFLCRLPGAAVAELVPKDAALLVDVFPVLGRVSAIAKAPRPNHTACYVACPVAVKRAARCTGLAVTGLLEAGSLQTSWQ